MCRERGRNWEADVNTRCVFMNNSGVMAIGMERKGNSLLLNGIDSSLEIIFAECSVPVAEINFLCFLWLVLPHCSWAKKWKRWKLVGWNNSKFPIQMKIRQAGLGCSLQLLSVLYFILFLITKISYYAFPVIFRVNFESFSLFGCFSWWSMKNTQMWVCWRW